MDRGQDLVMAERRGEDVAMTAKVSSLQLKVGSWRL